MINRFRALWILPVLFLVACGGGGGGGGSSSGLPNKSPTANFAFVCADLACDLTSTSSDEDVGDAISAFSWSFGDGSVGASTANPSHTFTAAGSYDVTLTVSDRSGATGSIVRKVAVTAPATAGPHATFTASCVSLDCTFTDTSTFGAGSVFASRVWDYGDSVTASATNPVTHTYAATTLTTFVAKLTVTDAGGKVSTSSRSVVVAPPATTVNCTGAGCVALTLLQASRVTATILSHSCSATGNEVALTSPVKESLFADGCVDTVNVPKLVGGGQTFAANTVLQFEVRSGFSADASLVFPPSVKVAGSFALGWTLTFDDGYGGSGEPDFNDLVILIKAVP
jgi:PKD repeat protein